MATPKDPIFDLLYSTYKRNPNLFTNEDVDYLKGRASQLGADFQIENNDVNLIRAAQQAYYGFINGFTTLDVGEDPRNDVESIFHNIGHLAGFMGFIPGAGMLARGAAFGFSKGIGMFMGREIAEAGAKYAVKGITSLYGNSLPMAGANLIMKGASSLMAKNAALESIAFLKNGSVARDILQGATHLGIASAISAAPSVPIVQWDWAIDRRLEGLIGGAEAGAAFRVLGNVIKASNIKGLAGKMDIDGKFLDDFDKQQKITNVARAMAGAAYMGLPSTMNDDPGLIQVYQYINGAAFGRMEKSVHERQAGEFIREQRRSGSEPALLDVFSENPKLKGWDELTEEAQGLVRASTQFSIGRIHKATSEYLEATGLPEFTDATVILSKGMGKALDQIKDDLAAGKITGRQAKQYAASLDWVKRAQEYKETGMSEERAFEAAAQDASTDAKRQYAVNAQLDAIMLKARAENEASSTVDALLSGAVMRDISDTIREQDADARFINPFYDAARSIQQKPKADTPLMSEGIFRFSVLRDMLSLSAQVRKGGGDVETFIAKIESIYGELKPEDKGRFKQAWLNVYDSPIQPQISVDAETGRVTETTETRPDGVRAIMQRPYSFAENVLSDFMGEGTRAIFLGDSFTTSRSAGDVQYNEVGKLYGEKGAIDVDVKDASALPGLFQHVAARGQFVLGGMKANDRLVILNELAKPSGIRNDPEGAMIEYSVGDATPFALRDKLDAADEVIKALNANRPKDKQLDDAYTVLEKEFREYEKIFREHGEKKFKEVSEAELRRMFERDYVNNMVFMELINGNGKTYEHAMPWEFIIANPDKFIKDVTELNKRNQVIHAGEHRVSSKYFSNAEGKDLPGILRDADGRAMLNYAILDSKMSGFIDADGVSRPITAWQMSMENGVPTPKRVTRDQWQDGALMVRGDVFDALMRYAGINESTGHQKGTFVHTEAGLGMVLGKFAYHRAAPELDAIMQRDGLHMLAWDTAVKQTGFRDKVGLEYHEGSGYRFVGKAMASYKLPAEAMSINFSAGEHPHSQLANQRAVVQLYSNLNLQQADPMVLEEMYKFMNDLGFKGKQEANNAFAAYEATMRAAEKLEKTDVAGAERIKEAFDIKKLKVEDLGVSETIRILKDPYLSRTPIYDKLMRHILKLDKEGQLREVDDGVVDEYTAAVDAALENSRSGALRAFELVDRIDPAMVESHPTLSQYAQAVQTAYVIKKAKRPEIPYSMKAIMTPYQLEYHAKYNLQPGTYMLDAGMKDKPIEFHTDFNKVEEIPLGEAWRRYQEVASKPGGVTERDAQLMELWVEDMTHAVVRVPADSMSGIRMLQFRGFTNLTRTVGEKKSEGPLVAKIISGGQTGIDRLGLEIGKELGVETGGTAPLGYRTEKGNDPSLKGFGLVESKSRDWLPRTEENVKQSDGTVYFATDADSAGLIATRRYATQHKKPFLLNPTKGELRAWIKRHNVKTLNVAGNRMSRLDEETLALARSVLKSIGETSSEKITQSAGYGILLHPEDMVNLGGADLDIDSAFIYTKLPKAVKDAYGSRENMYEWYKYYKKNPETGEFFIDNGKPIETSPDDPLAEAVFIPHDVNNKFSVKAVEDGAMSALKKHPMSMFNPAMTVRTNQEVYNANMILGPGLYHTRRLMSVYDMRGGGPVPMVKKGKIGEYVTEKLGLGNGDVVANVVGIPKRGTYGVRNAARTIVNDGADAKGRYKSTGTIANGATDQMFENFFATAFKGKKKVHHKFTSEDFARWHAEKYPGKASYFMFNNPDYRYLQSLDLLGKLYDYDNGRRMTLDDLRYGESPLAMQHHESFKPANVWYRIAQDISKSIRDNMPMVPLKEQVYGKEWTGEWSFKESRFKPGQKAELMKWLHSDDPLAQELRMFTFRKDTNIAAPGGANDPWAKAQDAMDWVSIGIMRKYGRAALEAGYKLSDLRKIAEQVDAYKKANSKRLNVIDQLSGMKSADEGEISADKYQSRDITKSELYKDITKQFKAWYDKSPELHSFASAWYTGSLYTQPMSINRYLAPIRKKIVDIQNRLKSVEVQDKKHAKMSADLSRLQFVEKQKIGEWYQTNFGSLGLNSPFIPDHIIKEYFDTFNDVVGSTFKPSLTEAEIKEVFARSNFRASDAIAGVQPDSKAFLGTEPVRELTKKGDVKRFQQSFYAGIEPMKKLELDIRFQKLSDDIADILYKNPQLIPHFSERIMGPLSEELGIIPSSPNIMTVERLQQSVDALKRVTKGDLTPMKLSWYHWFLPPSYVAQKMTGYDPHEFLYKSVPTATGISDAQAVTRDLPVRTFFSTMELMRRNMNAMEKLEERSNSLYEREWRESFWLFDKLGADARRLSEIATALREEGRSRQSAEQSPYYGLEAEKARKELAKFAGRTWDVPHPTKGMQRLTAEDVIAEFNAKSTIAAETAYKRWVYNKALDSYANKVIAGQKNFTPEEIEIGKWVSFNKHGLIDLDRTFARIQNSAIEETFNEMPYLSMDFLNRLVWQTNMENFRVKNENDEFVPIRKLKVPEGRQADDYRSEVISAVLRDPSLNVDGKLNYRSFEDRKIFFDEYHPHVDHSRKALKVALQQRIARLKQAGAGEEVHAQAEMVLKNEIERLTSTDLGLINDLEASLSPKDRLTTVEGTKEAGLGFMPRNLMGRSLEFGPIPTYDKTALAWLSYNRSMSKAYYKGLEAWINHRRLQKFEEEAPFRENNEAWAAYLHTYRRNSLGLPSFFPNEWLERKDFYIKNNAYYLFTDQAMWRYLSRAEKALGHKFGDNMDWDKYKKMVHDNNGGLGKINTDLNKASRDLHLMSEVGKVSQEISIYGRNKKEEIVIIGEKSSTQNRARAYEYAEKNGIPVAYRNQFDQALKPIKKLAEVDYEAISDARRYSGALLRFSMLEGKWNLISLLASTKSMVANITTGATNTAVSAGLGNLYRANSLKYINSVMPNLKSKDDVVKFRDEAAAIEGYIKDALGESVPYSESMKRFIQEGLDILKKNPDTEDITFMDLARKYKLGESVVNKAAWFMRTSEVITRGNSWMAHYLKGREVLGANNYLFPKDNHPWLIRFANRGVEGTQFLYNNANKPAFARTSVGKIFFRFQQWAMSSVLMRYEIARQAGLAGYREGTPQFEKFQRLMVADMFMLGLATVFPATFFDSNLAPPLSTMVDISNYFYGDNKDRERAFFGNIQYPYSPLNMITPPAGRIPTGVFGLMVSGDWDQFVDHNLYTWFPFGRIGRDIKRTLENPVMIIENMTNVPIHQMDRQTRKVVADDSTPKQMFNSFINSALSQAFEEDL